MRRPNVSCSARSIQLFIFGTEIDDRRHEHDSICTRPAPTQNKPAQNNRLPSFSPLYTTARHIWSERRRSDDADILMVDEMTVLFYSMHGTCDRRNITTENR